MSKKKTPSQHYEVLKGFLSENRFVLDVANFLNVSYCQAGRILNQLENSGYVVMSTAMSEKKSNLKIRSYKAVEKKGKYKQTILNQKWV